MPPPKSDDKGLGWWLLGAGVGFFAFMSVAVAASRRRGAALTGQLIAEAGPAGALLPPPRDLGAEGRRAVKLGQKGEAGWQLVGWGGAAILHADAWGAVLLTPQNGEVRLNDLPLKRAARLHDGDVFLCGEYRIRYENLLM